MAVTAWEVRGSPVWWIQVRSFLVLAGVGFAVAVGPPQPDWSGPGRWTALGLAGMLVAWVLWVFAADDSVRMRLGVYLSGAFGVLLSFTNPQSAALAYPAIACVTAAARTRPRWSIGLAVALTVIFDGGVWLRYGPRWVMVVAPATFVGGLLIGLVRRQSSLLLRETEHTRAEQARSAALAERARIAREIHDVLAHALAALTVQLETADALLEGGRAEQARASVVRAGKLAREGLAETKRAIGALRGDPLPLPELLDALATGYRADLGGTASVHVDGVPRDLNPDTALALYRTAQEAITNVRKHAPGAPLDVRLSYAPDTVDLTVVNGAAPAGTLAGTGGGYGLIGLRERAELAGGSCTAGPQDDGWRVDARIPT